MATIAALATLMAMSLVQRSSHAYDEARPAPGTSSRKARMVSGGGMTVGSHGVFNLTTASDAAVEAWLSEDGVPEAVRDGVLALHQAGVLIGVHQVMHIERLKLAHR